MDIRDEKDHHGVTEKGDIKNDLKKTLKSPYGSDRQRGWGREGRKQAGIPGRGTNMTKGMNRIVV